MEAFVTGAEGRGRVRVRLVIDTGARFGVHLSPSTARAAGIVAGGARRGVTVTGARDVRSGVAPRLDLGPFSLESLDASIPDSAAQAVESIGMGALERLGGIAFDWRDGTVVLIPRGASTCRTRAGLPLDPADPRWAAARWSADPIVVAGPEAGGPEGMEAVYTGGHRWTSVAVGDRRFHGVLDTGSTGDLFAFVPVPVRSPGRTVSISAFGPSRCAVAATLAAPAEIAGVHFEPVEADRLVGPGLSADDRLGRELIIGLGLLRRYPLWLDLERDAVRIWQGQ